MSKLERAGRQIAEAVLHSESPASLHTRLLAILRQAIGFDCAATLSARPGERWLVTTEEVVAQPMKDEQWRFASQISAHDWADFSLGFRRERALAEVRRPGALGLYAGLFQPLGLRELVARYWVSHNRAYVIGLTRVKRDFPERVCLQLDILFPYLAAALRVGPLLTRDASGSMVIEIAEVSGLSRRQRQVAEYVVRGLSNKEIASSLCMSSNTVRNILVDVFRKLRVSSRMELVSQILANPSQALTPARCSEPREPGTRCWQPALGTNRLFGTRSQAKDAP